MDPSLHDPSGKRPHGVAAWRLVRAAMSMCLVFGCAAAPIPGEAGKQKDRPQWVIDGGNSRAHPTRDFVTGFGVAEGQDALVQARQMAARDLASRITVRIESELSDASRERSGRYEYELAVITRTTTDVKLSNLSYFTWEERKRAFALAVVDRVAAAADRRRARDRALQALRACLAAAERLEREDRRARAMETYETCRKPVAEALQSDAVAHALQPGQPDDAEVIAELTRATARIDREIEAVLVAAGRSLESSSDALALQLARQGVSKHSRLSVGHFSYGTTQLSSTFGRRAGQQLERALARLDGPTDGAAGPALAVRGVYVEQGDAIRLSATVSEVESGRLVASADARLSADAIADRSELKPANFETALIDQKILAEGGLLSGDLRVEVWTDRGRGGVLYSEREELKLYLRVNQPAWIRLIYVLQNGMKVPIDHAYYVDRSKVNFVIEYPDSFEIVPPFGIEMIHATAFTQEPPQLRTEARVIDGVEYEVLADGLGSVVRTRGLARKQKQALAEDYVTVTTTPR